MASMERQISHTAQSGIFKNSPGEQLNVGENERLASIFGGAALAIFGLTRFNLSGAILGLVGGSLLYRGVTGRCNVYKMMGINTSRTGENVSVKGDSGVRVEKQITINRSPEDLYNYWRTLENLPKIMSHLESVRTLGENRSHWIAKAPAGTTVEWDAEIINDKESELIAWRSLEGSEVDNAGSVRFEGTPGGSSTRVKVELRYAPPMGAIGAAVAKLFGEDPETQIEEDLRKFKQTMEAQGTTGAGKASRAARTGE
jgi:uncharacterized membrane protein